MPGRCRQIGTSRPRAAFTAARAPKSMRSQRAEGNRILVAERAALRLESRPALGMQGVIAGPGPGAAPSPGIPTVNRAGFPGTPLREVASASRNRPQRQEARR